MKEGSLFEAYRKRERAGSGTSGEVFLATCLESQRDVAIKRLRKLDKDEWEQQLSHKEASILRALQGSPHVIQLVEEFKDVNDKLHYLVMEQMQHDLRGLLDCAFISKRWSRGQIKGYARQLFLGLDWCHTHGYMHRDIKPENLLLDKNNVLKLTDFGLAGQIRKGCAQRNLICTRWYRPPEIFYGETHYGPEVDIWGAACVLGEMLQHTVLMPGITEADQLCCIYELCGTPAENGWPEAATLPAWRQYAPARAYPKRDLQNKLGKQNKLTERLMFFSPVAVELLDGMLALNPKKRLSASDALKHPYFGAERDGIPLMEHQDMPKWNKNSYFGGGNAAKPK